MHDNSENPPEYVLQVTNLDNSQISATSVAQISFNLKPKLLKNKIKILRGERLLFTSSMLSASDPDSNQALLVFFISNILYGRFEHLQNLGFSITVFSQQDIFNQQIYFIHDGGYNAPSYEVSVSDGAIKLPPETAAVEFLIPKGICGLDKRKELNSGMMMGIALSADDNYLIAGLFSGETRVFNIYDQLNPYLNQTLNLNDQNIKKNEINAENFCRSDEFDPNWELKV